VTDWLLDLGVVWLALLVAGAATVVTLAVYLGDQALSRSRLGSGLRSMSPGMLPPMGLLFGLLVGFLAADVWDDTGRAQAAVDQEASALRSTMLVSAAFPQSTQAQLRKLIRSQIQYEVQEEWPAMARREVTLAVLPGPLSEALQRTLTITPRSKGQEVAQRELVGSVQRAFDARRDRIILSESGINGLKWAGVITLAVMMLVAIAFVHPNRVGSLAAMGLFAAAASACFVLLAAQDEPFAGPFRVEPDALVQVMPRP
jgi:hypothetical protein